MNTKSYAIGVTEDGFVIMETTAAWRKFACGEHRIANAVIRHVETLRYDAGNTYEDAEARVRGWYRTVAYVHDAPKRGQISDKLTPIG